MWTHSWIDSWASVSLSWLARQWTVTSNQFCVHNLFRRTGCSVGAWRGLHCWKPSSLSLLMWTPRYLYKWTLHSLRLGDGQGRASAEHSPVWSELISFIICRFSCQSSALLWNNGSQNPNFTFSAFDNIYDILNCFKCITADCCYMLFLNYLFVLFQRSLRDWKRPF